MDSNDYFENLKNYSKKNGFNVNYGKIYNESADRRKHENNIATAIGSLMLIAGGCYFLYKRVWKPLKKFFSSEKVKDLVVVMNEAFGNSRNHNPRYYSGRPMSPKELRLKQMGITRKAIEEAEDAEFIINDDDSDDTLLK